MANETRSLPDSGGSLVMSPTTAPRTRFKAMGLRSLLALSMMAEITMFWRSILPRSELGSECHEPFS